MLELHKFSPKITEMSLNVFSAQTTQNVNRRNYFCIEDSYDWTLEKKESKNVRYICNQFIHAYLSFLERDSNRYWSNSFIVSDFDKKEVIWRIPFSTITNLFKCASDDWPKSFLMAYDEKAGDYKVETS